MRPSSAAARGSLLLATLLACTAKPADDGDDSGDSGADSGDSGDTAPDSGNDSGASGDIVLADANNYEYTGLLDGPTVVTAELTDLTIDWSELTLDLQCHDMDPVDDVDNVAALPFPLLSEEEVEAGLAAGDLQQADLGGYVSLAVGDRTSANLSELTFFGTDVDIESLYAEGSATWLLILTSGDTVGVGSRTLLFMEPHADSDNTEVRFENDCDILDFDANLSALTPVTIPVGGPWSLDWWGLTVDGQGNPIELGNIDRVMVGRYADLTPEALAAQFLDLELVASGLWTWHLEGGTTLDLTVPPDEGGAFPGFGDDGTWILALRCSLCPNPAPLFLTVLNPV